jgi:hypothetical protein
MMELVTVETDDDVDDVIALMRLNYYRVVARHGLPEVAGRWLCDGRARLPG